MFTLILSIFFCLLFILYFLGSISLLPDALGPIIALGAFGVSLPFLPLLTRFGMVTGEWWIGPTPSGLLLVMIVYLVAIFIIGFLIKKLISITPIRSDCP